jgi:hypothetical protein
MTTAPLMLEPDYREAIRAEAHMPAGTATHYAIARHLLDTGVLPNTSQRTAEAIVREWRKRPRHRPTLLHWRAWVGSL